MAKKTEEEMLTTYCMARNGWLKIALCDVLLGPAYRKQIYTENKSCLKFPSHPFFILHSLNIKVLSDSEWLLPGNIGALYFESVATGSYFQPYQPVHHRLLLSTYCNLITQLNRAGCSLK